MDTSLTILLVLAGVLLAAGFLIWAGLRIAFPPFAPCARPGAQPEALPLPPNLPAPVERFYRKIYGERIPLVISAVISGRMKARPAGPFYFPGRFRFSHLAGQGYRHYIEIGLFGMPLIKVNERYLDGRSLFDSPMGHIDDDPNTNQGANLALWAEALWFPAILLTDPRVRWQAVDDVTAILMVPGADGGELPKESFVVRFDPHTGLITYLESMRFQTPQSSQKVLWLNKADAWEVLDGQLNTTKCSVIWMNDGKPWAMLDVEEITLNADLEQYIRQTGP